MKNIILDTDIGPDCDDAGALALLHLLADQGYCRILGVAHCTSNPYGAGTIDVINRYYGRPDINVSTYSGEGFLVAENCMKYNRYITTHFPNRYQAEQPEDAVKMYRRLLGSSEDKSVECIAIGPQNNLSALLDSQPDEYSSFNGAELVERKVKRLTIMGGVFRGSSQRISDRVEAFSKKKIEEIAEWNIGCDIQAARNVADHWNTPKVYVGLEAGLILTGAGMQETLPEEHPVRLAYRLFTKNGERYSWDLLAVESAVVDDSPHYKKSAAGRIQFSEEGITLYTPLENGSDYYIELAQPDEVIAGDINRLLRKK